MWTDTSILVIISIFLWLCALLLKYDLNLRILYVHSIFYITSVIGILDSKNPYNPFYEVLRKVFLRNRKIKGKTKTKNQREKREKIS